MAKATLPTNFKDDILASSMGSKRRYNVINNSDGTISLEDVTTYTQVGSTFGAAQINATNKAANAAADASKIIDDYDTLMANTASGYMAGALAVKELNSNLGGKLLWTNSSPSSTFANQTISLDLSEYNYIIISAIDTDDIETEKYSLIKVGSQNNIIGLKHRTAVDIRVRTVDVSTESVVFGTGKDVSGGVTNGNKYAVPYHIYGIKQIALV